MSERKVGAARRRDARATKSEETSPGQGSKKNTRKWCRGKVGVEHVLACMKKYPDTTWASDWVVLACTVCGKELEYWSPPLLGQKYKPKPAWVVL